MKIVHSGFRVLEGITIPKKVSFDLTKGDTTKLDAVNKDNLVVPSAVNEDILTNISDENRDIFPCSASSGSSCHSSRCCCSSYVCSMCSPRHSEQNQFQKQKFSDTTF